MLITGGGRNIGVEITRTFAERGYQIAITGRNATEIAEAASALSRDYPQASIHGYPLELSDMSSIRELMDKLGGDFSHIDVLVCNAGHLGIGMDIHNTNEADYDAVFDTNVKGNFFLIQAISRIMIAAGHGSIVIVNSVQSKGAVAGRTVYGTTKGALQVLNKYLACDLAPYGIRVNTVTLGAVHTDRWDSLPEDVAKKRRNAYPLGREASAEEVGNAVLFLAEKTAASMTGTELCVDSGLTACLKPYADRKD